MLARRGERLMAMGREELLASREKKSKWASVSHRIVSFSSDWC